MSMTSQDDKPLPVVDRLLRIIKTQTEIAKLGLDLGGVMALVAERAQKLTLADGAVVELAEGDEMVYRAACGSAEPQLGLRLKREGSLSGLCVDTGKTLRCDNAETDVRVDRDACRRVGLLSMLVVPLTHHETVVGVLKVISRQVNTFGDSDIEILELMSELIAAAMFHATQYEANELFQRATQDALTGIANRALFFDRLRQSLAQAKRTSKCLGILFLDMDNLKQINDEHGHRAGDAALKELVRRIMGVLRQSDTVARLGGDEFGIILTHIDHPSGAMLAAKRLAERIESPFLFERHELSLAASIGRSLFPDDGEQMDVLLEKADQSMYAEKRLRKHS
jgi:diguanylate cyclase (GGDEF)-like protein